MMTEKERKWLENRKIRCSRCVHYEVSGVGGICFWCADREKFETSAYTLASDYRDAAKFEARVSRCIAGNASELDMISNNLQFLDGFKAKSLAWYILREARIAVEEEMDECLSPRL